MEEMYVQIQILECGQNTLHEYSMCATCRMYDTIICLILFALSLRNCFHVHVFGVSRSNP